MPSPRPTAADTARSRRQAIDRAHIASGAAVAGATGLSLFSGPLAPIVTPLTLGVGLATGCGATCHAYTPVAEPSFTVTRAPEVETFEMPPEVAEILRQNALKKRKVHGGSCPPSN